MIDSLSSHRATRAPTARLLGAAALAAADFGARGLPLWRAAQMSDLRTPTLSSGWPALDAELPGGGWPLAGLFELLCEPSSGELTLLAPWLRALNHRSAGSRELLWVAPPGAPCVAALQQLGLCLPRLVCVEPGSSADAAWAAEQALRTGSCAAVMWWSRGALGLPTLRRLHLAAQLGGTPLVLLRALAARSTSSPAPLRVACAAGAQRRIGVEVFKRRGPPMAAPLMLSLPWPASAGRREASASSAGAVAAALFSVATSAADSGAVAGAVSDAVSDAAGVLAARSGPRG